MITVVKNSVANVLKTCLLIVISLLFSLLLCEGLLRGVFPQRLIYKMGHPLTLSVHIPNFKGVVYNPYEKGLKVKLQFNAQGFRQRYGEPLKRIPYEKDPSTYRILCLGDSVVESAQVEWEESFPVKLQNMFEANPSGKKVEVLSMGVGGWDQANELVYYKIEGAKFRPDLLVLFIFLHNDPGGNLITWKALKKIYESHESGYFVKRSPLEEAKIYVGSHSYVYSLLKRASELGEPEANASWIQKPLIALRESLRKLQKQMKVVNVPETTAKHGYPKSRQWELMEELLGEFKGLTSRSKTDLLLVIVPGKETGDGNPETMAILDGARGVAKRLGLSDIDLYSKFREKGPLSSFYYEKDKHFNVGGHEAVAQILYEAFSKR